jgi:preprotein translocase subunit SecG
VRRVAYLVIVLMRRPNFFFFGSGGNSSLLAGPSRFYIIRLSTGSFMETFVAVLHLIIALLLIVLVLVQDSKTGSLGGAFGGGGSNSVFGATGASTLAQKLTRWTAVIFAGTCIALTMMSARSHKSVIDLAMPAAATTAPATSPESAAAPATPAAPPAEPTKTSK